MSFVNRPGAPIKSRGNSLSLRPPMDELQYQTLSSPASMATPSWNQQAHDMPPPMQPGNTLSPDGGDMAMPGQPSMPHGMPQLGNTLSPYIDWLMRMRQQLAGQQGQMGDGGQGHSSYFPSRSPYVRS